MIPKKGSNMKFQKMLKSGWGEIIFLVVINVMLIILNVFAYQMTTGLWAMLLFFLFLLIIIIYSYRKRFDSLGLNLTQKGTNFLFIKTCLPHILQTTFFAQCSLLIGWILNNLSRWQRQGF